VREKLIAVLSQRGIRELTDMITLRFDDGWFYAFWAARVRWGNTALAAAIGATM
jgi:hypothetical protein